jgi:hypothetical protein
VKHESTNYVVKGDTLIRVLFATIISLILTSFFLYRSITMMDQKFTRDIAVLNDRVLRLQEVTTDWQIQRDITYHDNIIDKLKEGKGVQ